MKIGHVTASGQARVRISVMGASGSKEEIEALLDTGFNAREQTVRIAEAGEPLVGIALLREHDLHVQQCREGGRVAIED